MLISFTGTTSARSHTSAQNQSDYPNSNSIPFQLDGGLVVPSPLKILAEQAEKYSQHPRFNDVKEILNALIEKPAAMDFMKRVYGEQVDIRAQVTRMFQAARAFKIFFPKNEQNGIYTRAGGRQEKGGNHTDHSGGRANVATTDLDMLAYAAPNGTNTIRLVSRGFRGANESMVVSMDIPHDGSELPKVKGVESNLAGMINGLSKLNRFPPGTLRGFDVVVIGQIPEGSGISSSAAFHMALLKAVNDLFYGGKISLPEMVHISQKDIEHNQWGKKSGEIDQYGCGKGGMNMIDSKDPKNTVVTPITGYKNLEKAGYRTVLVTTGTSHSGDSGSYNNIPEAMWEGAKHFGKNRLIEVDPKEFEDGLPGLELALAERSKDHARNQFVVRSGRHFFAEDNRAEEQADALNNNDIPKYLRVTYESRVSSRKNLGYTHTKDGRIDAMLDAVETVIRPDLDNAGVAGLMGGGYGGALIVDYRAELYGELERVLKPFLGSGSKIYPVQISEEGAVNLTQSILSAGIK